MREICETILGLYEDNCNEIECDFILNNLNENILAKGKASIKRYSYNDHIKIYGSIKDVDAKLGVRKTINVSNIPLYYECTLLNLPDENRREDILGNIEIKFPKVRVLSDFTIEVNNNMYKAEIQPLYTYDKGEVMTINLNEI